ncbi:hypothetical protein [Parasitella parasitica]|uniref:DUF4218 domain-containing protein n=1 Tax=Parasitella parasitica TaxID=35722 RepID=A0A0B7NEX4_9FUNG|nr:hypothetical protein [Parasitella parasitica]
MGPQIKKFFSSIKDSVYYLKPKICDEIGDCLAENSATMPLIFEGILIDVFSSGSRARGVDWLLFLKYFVGTVLVDYVRYKSKISQEVVAEAKKALQAVSLICSICLQHVITKEDIQHLEALIILWHNFLRTHMPATVFTINQHYLVHIVTFIKKMGPLPQISCRSLERRIQFMKSEIRSCSHVEKNAENIFLRNSYHNQKKRSTANFFHGLDNKISLTFGAAGILNNSTESAYLLFLLSSHYNVSIQDLEQNTFSIAHSVCLGKKKTSDCSLNPPPTHSVCLGKNKIFDSSLNPPPRKKKLAKYALAKSAAHGDLPCLIKVLLIFHHEHAEKRSTFVYCQVYQNVTVSFSGIPECEFDDSNSDTFGKNWDVRLLALDDLITSVAILKSPLSNKLFFFWPNMKRVGLQVDCNDRTSSYEHAYDDETIHDPPRKRQKRSRHL